MSDQRDQPGTFHQFPLLPVELQFAVISLAWADHVLNCTTLTVIPLGPTTSSPSQSTIYPFLLVNRLFRNETIRLAKPRIVAPLNPGTQDPQLLQQIYFDASTEILGLDFTNLHDPLSAAHLARLSVPFAKGVLSIRIFLDYAKHLRLAMRRRRPLPFWSELRKTFPELKRVQVWAARGDDVMNWRCVREGEYREGEDRYGIEWWGDERLPEGGDGGDSE